MIYHQGARFQEDVLAIRGPIVVATDLSDGAAEALRQAHAMASAAGVRLVIGHALPEAFNVRVLFPHEAGIDAAAQQEIERRALDAIRQHADQVIGAAAASASIELETGTPHAGILAIAERLGAALIVVGPGATAHRIARGAHGPVLVARPSPDGGAVLGATDFSDPSLPALRLAAEEAARRGVPFRALHCLDVNESAYVGSAGLPGAIAPWPLPLPVIQDLERAAQQRLAAALQTLGVGGDALVLRRSPAVGIVEAAESVATALVVVGTRGRTGLSRLALGSVAELVMDRAPCSVITVPLHPA